MNDKIEGHFECFGCSRDNKMFFFLIPKTNDFMSYTLYLLQWAWKILRRPRQDESFGSPWNQFLTQDDFLINLIGACLEEYFHPWYNTGMRPSLGLITFLREITGMSRSRPWRKSLLIYSFVSIIVPKTWSLFCEFCDNKATKKFVKSWHRILVL